MADALRISEIFFSLQGESRTIGLPTVFVRLTGCPLRCRWCDSAYAFNGGQMMDLSDILDQVAQHPTRHVTVTGGEPLAQPGVHALMKRLCDAGLAVSIETSGALDVSAIDPRVSKVMDLKAPGSDEAHRNLWSNLDHLQTSDQIKFVLADRTDYEWARLALDQHNLNSKVDEVLMSPVHGELAPRELAEWILADGLNVRMQLQMHKYLWGEEPGH
ncbi:MAG: 7-carboxy-7-deazaguanine synthase QueE [Litorivicinus sp.]